MGCFRAGGLRCAGRRFAAWGVHVLFLGRSRRSAPPVRLTPMGLQALADPVAVDMRRPKCRYGRDLGVSGVTGTASLKR